MILLPKKSISCCSAVLSQSSMFEQAEMPFIMLYKHTETEQLSKLISGLFLGLQSDKNTHSGKLQLKQKKIEI